MMLTSFRVWQTCMAALTAQHVYGLWSMTAQGKVCKVKERTWTRNHCAGWSKRFPKPHQCVRDPERASGRLGWPDISHTIATRETQPRSLRRIRNSLLLNTSCRKHG